MNLIEYLETNHDCIVNEALEAVRRTHLKHYEESGLEATRDRLRALFNLALRSVREKRLDYITAHAQAVARDRFNSGFDLGEVQTAFNVLEEVMWKHITHELPPDRMAEALGMVGTVLGAGKDRLAREYVALASKTRTPSLDVAAMFKGVEGT